MVYSLNSDPGITLKIKSRAWVNTDVGSNFNISCEASGKWIRDHIYATKEAASSSSATTVSASIGEGEPKSSSEKKKIINWLLDDVPVGVLFPEWKVTLIEKCAKLLLT